MKKKKILNLKSRNFVAKNAKFSGSGLHTDKKYNLKLGVFKHKIKLGEE